MPTQSILFDSIIFGFLAIDFGVIIVFLIQWARVGKKIFTPIAAAIFLFMVFSGGIAIYGSFIEPWKISVMEYQAKNIIPSLPGGTDIKIALIADFHLGPYKGRRFVEKTVKKLNELDPDLILIAGDFVFVKDINAIPGIMEEFSPLKELSPPLGMYAVLGNHDHGETRPEIAGVEGKNRAGLVIHGLEKTGVKVLVNESTVITQDGVPLFELGGLAEVWTGRADIKRTFGENPGGNSLPRVLLAHNPDTVLMDNICDTDLVLAGHTHGGQIRLPYWGPIPRIPDLLGKAFDQGYFPGTNECGKNGTIPARPLLITRGIGESGPRARLFAEPEIVFIY